VITIDTECYFRIRYHKNVAATSYDRIVTEYQFSILIIQNYCNGIKGLFTLTGSQVCQ